MSSFTIPGVSHFDRVKPQSLQKLPQAVQRNGRDEVLLKTAQGEHHLLHADNLHLSPEIKQGSVLTVDGVQGQVLWIDDEPENGHWLQHGLLLGGGVSVGLAVGAFAGGVAGSSLPVLGTLALGATGAAVGGKLGSEAAYALADKWNAPIPRRETVTPHLMTENDAFFREVAVH